MAVQPYSATAPIKALAGTEASPGITFTGGDTDTGIYSPAANQLGITTGGTSKLIIDENGSLQVVRGTKDNPAIYFDGGTGIYSPGADQLAISTNGTERVEFGTGEVVFNDGGEEYDFRIEGDTEANLFFVDASTSRVGLGTSSPDKLLHIQGDTAEFKGTNTNAISDTAGTEQVFKFGIEGQKNGVYGPAGSIIFRQDGSTWSSVDANNKPTRIEFCTQDGDSTDRSETPRLVINQSGNVGIGDTEPSETLTVKGKSGVDPFSVSGPSSEFIRVDNGGRLLVGTSSAQRDSAVGRFPQIQLNSNNSSQNSSTLGIYANSAINNCSINLYRNRTTTAGGFDYTGGTVQADDVLGQIAFLGVDGQATPVMRTGATIDAVCESTPTATEMPSRLVFSTTADGTPSPTERMRISSNGTVNIAGELVLGPNSAPAVKSDTTGVTGADQITNMMSLTQAEYDAIASPDANTFYVITA